MVALVGRPNVGKSALFNRLVGADAAIVHGRPGVTRDQMARKAEWCGRTYTLVDCGGLSDDADGGRAAFEAERAPKRRERDIAATQLPRVIRDHAQRAVASADVLLFVVDGQAGPTAADADGARAPAWKRGR
jgi:GTP-binding protein